MAFGGIVKEQNLEESVDMIEYRHPAMLPLE